MPYKDERRRKEYHSEYNKGWYQRHKDEVIARRKKRQLEIRYWFMRYKSTLSCIDCGISHPAVLQFHHRNRSEKSFTIADVVRKASSLKQITDEINKCDVLCVNCHAKRHWRETHEKDSWEEIIPIEEE
jgi:hypothetical protein